jgi:hypothetical protein
MAPLVRFAAATRTRVPGRPPPVPELLDALAVDEVVLLVVDAVDEVVLLVVAPPVPPVDEVDAVDEVVDAPPPPAFPVLDVEVEVVAGLMLSPPPHASQRTGSSRSAPAARAEKEDGTSPSYTGAVASKTTRRR